MADPRAEIRIGVLGAAKIAPTALIRPAAELSGVTVSAIAARDPARAHAFARKHAVPRVRATYDELLSDPDVDALYIPTPVALHGRWATRGVEAGKHVLVEKPLTANGTEATALRDLAASSDVIVMEAMHTLHHPALRQLRTVLDEGEIGTVTSVQSSFHAPLPQNDPVRWSYELGGGALMDLGCYPISVVTELFGDAEIVSARARARGQVDTGMQVELLQNGRIRTSVSVGMSGFPLFSARLVVSGTAGRAKLGMPFQPHQGRGIVVDGVRGRRRVRVDRRSSFSFQLEAFRDAIRTGTEPRTGAGRAVRTMRTIDAIYRAAGMEPRTPQ